MLRLARSISHTDRRLSLELLEDRRLLVAGVTVITHGAQVFAGLPDWTVTMGQAVLDRADGASTARNAGSLFQHNPATGQWQAVGNAVWTNSNSLSDHIVLLYDWSDESSTLADGWLDAAADNLFASLVAVNNYLPGGLQARSFFDAARAAGGGGGLLDLHFIGHSRGAVLNSLVAARFDRYFGELTIDHVTTLDAHPASAMNDPGYVSNNPSVNSRVFTYDNVRFADNYFQNDNSYEPLSFDFDGVTANGAFNFQIPTPVLENGGAGTEHSDVHSWYYGTITTPFAANYAGFSGAGRNNDGDVSFPDAWWGASGVPARGATGFAFSTIGGASRTGLPLTGAKINAGIIPTVVDGDMAFGDDGFFSDALPGWESHGGAGTGPLGGDDLYVEMNSGGDDYFRRHNPLYFPKFTAAVEYDYWINDNDASQSDDQLQVLVGGFVIDTVPLAQITASFVRNRRAAYALPQGGVVMTLEFRILDASGDGIESAVRFDNVELVIQTPAPNADFDRDGDVDGDDFLRWQRGLGTFVTAPPGAGDADFDGNVRADDLAIWRMQFGTQGDSVAAFEAPSPSTDALMAVAARIDEPAATDAPFESSTFGPLLAFAELPVMPRSSWRPTRASDIPWPIATAAADAKPRRRTEFRPVSTDRVAAVDELFSQLGRRPEGLTLTAGRTSLKSLLS